MRPVMIDAADSLEVRCACRTMDGQLVAGRLHGWMLLLVALCLQAVHCGGQLVPPPPVVPQGRIHSWLRTLVIPIPPTTMQGPLGQSFVVEGGSCNSLQIGRLRTTDSGTPAVPQVGFTISGIGMQCRIIAQSGKHNVDFRISNSAADLRLAVQPYELPNLNLRLPLGQVRVMYCSLQVHMDSLSFSGTAFYESALQSLRGVIKHVVEKEAPKLACEQIRAKVQQQGTTAFAKLAQRLVPLFSQPVSPPPPIAQAELVDWGKYPPLQLGRMLLTYRVHIIHDLVSRIQTLELPIGLSHNFNLSGYSSDVLLKSARIDGLGAFVAPRDALHGAGPLIYLRAGITHARLTVQSELRVAPQTGQALLEDITTISDLQNTSLEVKVLAMIVASTLDALMIDQMQKPACLADCAKQATPSLVSDAFALENLVVDGIPQMQIAAPGQLGADIGTAITTTGAALLRGYQPEVRMLAGGLAAYFRPQLASFLDSTISTMQPCAESQVFLGPSHRVSRLLALLPVLCILLGLLASCFAACYARKESSSHNTNGSHMERKLFVEHASGTAEDFNMVHGIGAHKAVPRFTAVFFPFLVIGTFLSILNSIVNLGTVINLVITAGEQTKVIGPILTFSLVTCVVDSWNAGAYCIALVTLFLSGVWPLIKLVILLSFWVSPPCCFGYAARGHILRFLDEYGKYGIIDSWIGILSLVVYRLRWEAEDVVLSIESVVRPPFFVFIVATVLSLVCGHIASAYHQHVANFELGRSQLEDQKARATALCEAFGCEGHIVVVSIFLTIVLVMLGATLTTFEVTLSGAMADLVLEPEFQSHQYSLVRMGNFITAGLPPSLGLYTMQAIFFTFTLVIPLLLLNCLLGLWLLPMSRSMQEKVVFFCRVLDAWAALDVFTLAIFVAYLEFDTLASYMVYGNSLGVLCNMVKNTFNSPCFDPHFALKPGFAILTMASVSLFALPKVVLRMMKTAMEEETGGSSYTDSEIENANLSDEDSHETNVITHHNFKTLKRLC